MPPPPTRAYTASLARLSGNCEDRAAQTRNNNSYLYSAIGFRLNEYGGIIQEGVRLVVEVVLVSPLCCVNGIMLCDGAPESCPACAMLTQILCA